MMATWVGGGGVGWVKVPLWVLIRGTPGVGVLAGTLTRRAVRADLSRRAGEVFLVLNLADVFFFFGQHVVDFLDVLVG
jgi:hypothetical protein